MIRTRALPALVVVLAAIALGAVLILQSEASASRDAELKLANLKGALAELQFAPFQASPEVDGSDARTLEVMKRDKRQIDEALSGLREDSTAPTLDTVAAPLRQNYAALDKLFAVAVSGVGFEGRGKRLGEDAGRSIGTINRALRAASLDYDDHASSAELKATAGSAVTIALLVGAFLFLYRRALRARANAERLAFENGVLAATANRDARTDALTDLGNRRALTDDLGEESSGEGAEHELLVALFDLDGFKKYNDTFGHPAGDALLARLGKRLSGVVAGTGTAYRMGGDEFCVLARPQADESDSLARRAADALTEAGQGFQVGCSFGLALVPGEASSAEAALQMADRRMYDDKVGRSSAERQSADVLLEVINERSLDLREHIKEVAIRARATAEMLGVAEHEVAQIGVAAELHDIGKAAIPDTILNKAGPLDEGEIRFIRTHTVIGERIMLAAPSLAPLAGIVRSSHERYDGSGYPDGLHGPEISCGAAIIAVCDAYDAMVGSRPYRDPISVRAARDELKRCSGTQFDPAVVDAFLAVAESDTSTASTMSGWPDHACKRSA